MKARIAAAITDAHVEATGAPRAFVHVFFNELPPGIAYSAVELDTRISGITGAIRAGRPLEVKQKLITRIWKACGGLSPQLSLRRAKTACPEPTPANSLDRGSRK
jgi:hypothetical protein